MTAANVRGTDYQKQEGNQNDEVLPTRISLAGLIISSAVSTTVQRGYSHTTAASLSLDPLESARLSIEHHR